MVLLRRLLGDVLRERRREQGRTLREVSVRARVSLGYLSEVERGQKEASSELLGSICEALDLPLSTVLRDVSDHLALVEQVDAVEQGQSAAPVPLPAPAAEGPLHVTNVAA
jgi:transcriptional regulator with XRE-family HTH domain